MNKSPNTDVSANNNEYEGNNYKGQSRVILNICGTSY